MNTAIQSKLPLYILQLLESIEIQGLYGEEEYLAKLTLIKKYGFKSIN